MKKYVVSFEVEVYAPAGGPAFERACDLMAKNIRTQQRTGAMTTAIRAIGVPNAYMDGAPHTGETLDGWRMLVDIAEKTD